MYINIWFPPHEFNYPILRLECEIDRLLSGLPTVIYLDYPEGWQDYTIPVLTDITFNLNKEIHCCIEYSHKEHHRVIIDSVGSYNNIIVASAMLITATKRVIPWKKEGF